MYSRSLIKMLKTRSGVHMYNIFTLKSSVLVLEFLHAYMYVNSVLSFSFRPLESTLSFILVCALLVFLRCKVASCRLCCSWFSVVADRSVSWMPWLFSMTALLFYCGTVKLVFSSCGDLSWWIVQFVFQVLVWVLFIAFIGVAYMVSFFFAVHTAPIHGHLHSHSVFLP